MQIVKKTLAAAVILALTGPAFVMAADRTTANVSVDSVYYSYIDKLSGMGYLRRFRMAPAPTAVCRWPAGAWKRKKNQQKSLCRPIWLMS